MNHYLDCFTKFNFEYGVSIDRFRQSEVGDRLLTDHYMNVPLYFPLQYAEQKELSMQMRLQAMFCQSLLTLCLSSLEEVQPQDQTQIKAVNVFDGQPPVPYDLSGVYHLAQLGLRAALVQHNLQNVANFAELLSAWQSTYYMASEHHFVYHPDTHKDLDLISDINEFLQMIFRLQRRTFTLYFPEICCAPTNLMFSQKVLKQIDAMQLEYHLANPRSLQRTLAAVKEAALYLTRLIDDPLLLRIPEQTRTPSQGQGILQARQPRRRPAINMNLQILPQGFMTQRIIAGELRPIEYQPPLHFYDDFALREPKLLHPAQALITRLMKIMITQKREIPLEPLQVTGEPDAEEIYKKRLDPHFFIESDEENGKAVKLYVMLLVDNSCSMNVLKREKAADTLVTFALAIKACPEIFAQITAMAQHSSGDRKITLRLLLDAAPAELADLSPLLHLTSSGVNYDAFAAYELVHHCCERFHGVVPLLVLLGDAWPVGHSKDVREEQKELFALLKAEFPNLIVLYLATDQRYPPQELSYDYFVSATHDTSLMTIVGKIGETIEQIILEKTFCVAE